MATVGITATIKDLTDAGLMMSITPLFNSYV